MLWKGQPQLRLTLDSAGVALHDGPVDYHDDEAEMERVAQYDAARLAQWQQFAASLGVESVLRAVQVFEFLGEVGLLSRREQRILRLRWGLEDGRPKTLEFVGTEFKVTRERIRQVEARANRKVKSARTRKVFGSAGLNKEMAERLWLRMQRSQRGPDEE